MEDWNNLEGYLVISRFRYLEPPIYTLYAIKFGSRFVLRLARNRPAIYHRYCFIYRTEVGPMFFYEGKFATTLGKYSQYRVVSGNEVDRKLATSNRDEVRWLGKD